MNVYLGCLGGLTSQPRSTQTATSIANYSVASDQPKARQDIQLGLEAEHITLNDYQAHDISDLGGTLGVHEVCLHAL